MARAELQFHRGILKATWAQLFWSRELNSWVVELSFAGSSGQGDYHGQWVIKESFPLFDHFLDILATSSSRHLNISDLERMKAHLFFAEIDLKADLRAECPVRGSLVKVLRPLSSREVDKLHEDPDFKNALIQNAYALNY